MQTSNFLPLTKFRKLFSSFKCPESSETKDTRTEHVFI